MIKIIQFIQHLRAVISRSNTFAALTFLQDDSFVEVDPLHGADVRSRPQGQFNALSLQDVHEVEVI